MRCILAGTSMTCSRLLMQSMSSVSAILTSILSSYRILQKRGQQELLNTLEESRAEKQRPISLRNLQDPSIHPVHTPITQCYTIQSCVMRRQAARDYAKSPNKRVLGRQLLSLHLIARQAVELSIHGSHVICAVRFYYIYCTREHQHRACNCMSQARHERCRFWDCNAPSACHGSIEQLSMSCYALRHVSPARSLLYLICYFILTWVFFAPTHPQRISAVIVL
jgi:hypothetical protein